MLNSGNFLFRFQKLKDELRDHNLRQPICKCTSTTCADVFFLILSIYNRHRLNWITLEDICDMFNVIYNRKVIPSTKHTIKQTVGIDMENVEYYIYCQQCKKLLEKFQQGDDREFEIQCPCGFLATRENSSYFVSLDVCNQFKNLIEVAHLNGDLVYQQNREKKNIDGIEDIHDGNRYKLLQSRGQPLYSTNNFSYTSNTDGFPSAESSNTTIWPHYGIVNELSLNVRFKNKVLFGIWVDQCEPDMNTFLKPFVEKANFLSTQGFTWEEKSNDFVEKRKNHSLIVPTTFVVDSMARCKLLNMKQVSANQGCTFCNHITEDVEGTRKYTVSTEVPGLRTDEEIKTSMVNSITTNYDSKNGIKGPAVLMNLKYFDLAEGMSFDRLHGIDHGIVKHLTTVMLTSYGEDYYIGAPATLEIINKRLNGIRVPKCIRRTPRQITCWPSWKGGEWESWLLFYALPCLKDLIPKKYIDHLALLVTGVHILMQKSVTPKDLNYVKELFIKFNVKTQLYYGKKNMLFNFHISLHACDSIRNWGPYWLNDTYEFEDENRKILQMKASPTHVAIQLANKFLFKHAIKFYKSRFEISEHIQEFEEKLFSNKVKYFIKCHDTTLIGQGMNYNLTRDELSKISKIQNKKILESKLFLKFIVDGKRYTSVDYKREKKTDNSFFKHKNGDYGRIKKILYVRDNCEEESVILIYENYVLKRDNLIENDDVTTSHIKEFYSETEKPRKLRFCNPSDLDGPCLHMEINDRVYISFVSFGRLGC